MQNMVQTDEKHEFIIEYLQECRGYQKSLIVELNKALRLVQEGQSLPQTWVHEVFRLVHTVKGTSAYMGLNPIKNLSHVMENILQHLRDGQMLPSPPCLFLLIKASDELENLLNAVEEERLQDISIDGLLNQLQECAQGSLQIETENLVLKEISPQESNLRLNKSHYSQSLQALGSCQTIINDLANHILNLDDQIVLLKQTQKLGGDCLRGLLEVSNYLELNVEALKTRLAETAALSTQARMQSLKGIFKRFELLLLDLALKQSKSLAVQVKGCDISADSTLCDMLMGVLTHFARNIVDHGIESSSQRLASNKSAQALIQLEARLEGEVLVIELCDDGCGIDTQTLVQRAIHQRILSREQALGLTEAQKTELIFLPGVSSAKNISETSGRGVGMDAVMQMIRGVDGSLSVETKKNVGTKFVLKVPRLLVIENMIQTNSTEKYPHGKN